MRNIILFIALTFMIAVVHGQKTSYPHTIQWLPLKFENQSVRLAYMDVKPSNPNGETVLLLHGKNFSGYYWKYVISWLAAAGYRVVVPDQLGFGSSDKPNIHYSFNLMAANTDSLLTTLGIDKVNVIGHSMGGMLAARFTLMYPSRVRRLILENPIGLEDYRAFVPFRTIDQQYADELTADTASLKKYQQTYYPVWKPEYDQYVQAQYDAMQMPDFQTAAWASALTYDMIYQQPVVHEFEKIKAMTLIIIGQQDRTVVGKKLLSNDVADQHGNYPELGKQLQQKIKQSTLIELPGVGHIPHIQEPEKFRTEVLRFLSWK